MRAMPTARAIRSRSSLLSLSQKEGGWTKGTRMNDILDASTMKKAVDSIHRVRKASQK